MSGYVANRLIKIDGVDYAPGDVIPTAALLPHYFKNLVRRGHIGTVEQNPELDTAIADLIDSAPETLDTLNELAAAIGDNPNFYTWVDQDVTSGSSPTFDGSNITNVSTDIPTYVVGANANTYVTDGVADDVQIQEAIDAATVAGGVVILQSGTYDITSSILVKDNVTLRGVGNGTLLALDDAVESPVIYLNGVSNCQISDLTIDGNDDGQTTTDDNNGAGISVRATSTNILISNVRIHHSAGDGIYASGTINNLNVVNCEVDTPHNRGVHIAASNSRIYGGYFHNAIVHDGVQFGDGASNCVVIGAVCSDNAAKGLEAQVNSTNISMIGCIAKDNGDVGIALQQGADNCKIVDCDVSGNGNHGIHVDLTGGTPSNYALVQGCTVTDNGDAIGEMGLVIDNSDFARVIGNHVSGSSRHNIQLVGSDYCTVQGNVCMNGSQSVGTANGSGIEIETSNNNIVSGNVCVDNQGVPTQRYGIEIASGSNNIVTGNQAGLGNVSGSLLDSGTDTILANSQDIPVTRSVVTKDTTYALSTSDHIVVATTGTWTATLPAASGNTGVEFIISNQGNGVITVDANSTELINGSETQTLNQYESITIVCDGTGWIIL